MEAAWAVVAAVSARAEKCVSPFSHYKPTADLTPFFLGPGGAWGSFIWTAGDIGGWNGCVWVAFLGYEMVYFAVARTPKHLKLKSVAGV